MVKKILAAFLCLALILSFSGCSAAEGFGNWLEGLTSGASGLIPNDVEILLGQLTGKEETTTEHEMILSQGYVSMLKNGTYHIIYHLSDGTEVEFGSNGVNSASSYPDPSAEKNAEPEYDENGELIEAVIPQEHIVLKGGIYYYIDDNQATVYTVNPDNYKAVPFTISTDNIAFSTSGTEDFGGESCFYERYTTDSGDITFYYVDSVLKGMAVSQGAGYSLFDITAFNKYLKSSFVSVPSTYSVVEYWTAG